MPIQEIEPITEAFGTQLDIHHASLDNNVQFIVLYLSHTFALSSARPLLLKIRHHDGILDKSWLNRSYPGQPR